MEGEEQTQQQPQLVLANSIFLLKHPDVDDIEKVRLRDEVLAAVKSDNMVSLYQNLAAESMLELDQAVLKSMLAKNEEEIKKLDENGVWRFRCTGAIAATFVCPLDVIKTRFQVHGLPKLGSEMTKGSVIVGSLEQIFKKEGMRGFYRGLSPTVLALLPNWAAMTAEALSIVLRKSKRSDASQHRIQSDRRPCLLLRKLGPEGTWKEISLD